MKYKTKMKALLVQASKDLTHTIIKKIQISKTLMINLNHKIKMDKKN